MIDEEVTYKRQLDELKQDIGDLKSDLKGLVDVFKTTSRGRMSDAKGRIAEMARDRYERLQDLTNRGVYNARRVAGRARDAGSRAVERVQDKVEERPITSVLIALGVGVLLGRILKRR